LRDATEEQLCASTILNLPEIRRVTNHRNGLSIAFPSGNNATHATFASHTAAYFSVPHASALSTDLTHRFDFQPYSENDADDVRAHCNRRALLDKRLLEEVYEQIAMQTHLDTRDILLRARHGSVTIEGSVADRAMRTQIGNFVRRCPFVKSVINRVRTRDADCTNESWYADGRPDRAGDRSRARAVAA
jgi:hypothetical protein